MFFAHVALALLTARRFALAILVFSLATSIKMNVLLMAPSVLICVLQGSDLRSTAMGEHIPRDDWRPSLCTYIVVTHVH